VNFTNLVKNAVRVVIWSVFIFLLILGLNMLLFRFVLREVFYYYYAIIALEGCILVVVGVSFMEKRKTRVLHDYIFTKFTTTVKYPARPVLGVALIVVGFSLMLLCIFTPFLEFLKNLAIS